MTKAALAHDDDDWSSSPTYEHRSLRILLAEHDHRLRRLIALVLRPDGHFVVAATDGADPSSTIASFPSASRKPEPQSASGNPGALVQSI